MKKYIAVAEKQRRLILDTEDFLWKNPETGYREWKSHEYLKNIYEELGYKVKEAGDIPGFTAEVDTGVPGRTVAVFGEMDAMLIPEHPESDPSTGAVHACGHCAQNAALVGVAAALKEPEALEGLCGKIRLVVVPAEELIEIEYRLSLRAEGKIKYLGGKPEFLYRGLLDGVDLAFMVHTADTLAHTAGGNAGSNGLIAKTVTFEGKAAHAGGAPHKGINALYAANIALSAVNALRETFRDSDHIRVHPIITSGGSSVNAIPDKVTVESYVRGATMNAIAEVNKKVNRAVAASAAAMGAKAHITDFPGYWPRFNKADFMAVFAEAADSCGIKFDFNPAGWGTGCSDMGDIGSIMPAIHPYIGGAAGTGRGADFTMADPDTACVDSAKMQLVTLRLLLENEAARAKAIIADYGPVFSSKEEYFAYVDNLDMDKDVVLYDEKGNVTLDFHK